MADYSMEKLTEGYQLAEAPLWVEGRGLMFCDVMGGVFCVTRDGQVDTVFKHRRGIGGLSLHEKGGMIVSGRNISWKSVPEGETITVLDCDKSAGEVGFNDITTDSVGRIYAGSLRSAPLFEEEGREPQSGDLYLIDLDGSARKVAEDIVMTNGLAFSPDGRTLYHADTGRQHIISYDVATDGSLGPKRVFIDGDDTSPDGMAVTEDGRLWVALGSGGAVAVYQPDGSLDQMIEFPQPMCASLCFGGDDLRDLYVVSGSKGSDSDRAGAVYVTRVDVPGLPVPLARTPL